MPLRLTEIELMALQAARREAAERNVPKAPVYADGVPEYLPHAIKDKITDIVWGSDNVTNAVELVRLACKMQRDADNAHIKRAGVWMDDGLDDELHPLACEPQ